jgi:DNA ligase-1
LHLVGYEDEGIDVNRFADLLDMLVDAVAQRQALAVAGLFPHATRIPNAAMRSPRLPAISTSWRSSRRMMRALVSERMDAEVLFGYSYDYVGDLAETIADWPGRKSGLRPGPQ